MTLHNTFSHYITHVIETTMSWLHFGQEQQQQHHHVRASTFEFKYQPSFGFGALRIAVEAFVANGGGDSNSTSSIDSSKHSSTDSSCSTTITHDNNDAFVYFQIRDDDIVYDLPLLYDYAADAFLGVSPPNPPTGGASAPPPQTPACTYIHKNIKN